MYCSGFGFFGLGVAGHVYGLGLIGLCQFTRAGFVEGFFKSSKEFYFFFDGDPSEDGSVSSGQDCLLV